eukprot:SAG31_NODE_5783_length_2328_cov_3.748543_1_plen_58_part_00
MFCDVLRCSEMLIPAGRARTATTSTIGRSVMAHGQVRGCFLVFVPTIGEMRDFYREM